MNYEIGFIEKCAQYGIDPSEFQSLMGTANRPIPMRGGLGVSFIRNRARSKLKDLGVPTHTDIFGNINVMPGYLYQNYGDPNYGGYGLPGLPFRQQGVPWSGMGKQAARADYLRKAVTQLEDVVTRAQSKEMPKTRLADVDALSSLLARVKDKLGIEYAPTLRPTQHGGPHAWQANPYPLKDTVAPPRIQPAELERLLAGMRGAQADVGDLRKQWFRKLVDPDYHKNMSSAVESSTSAQRAFSDAVQARKSVERATQAAKDIRREMPRIKAVESSLTKQAARGEQFMNAVEQLKKLPGFSEKFVGATGHTGKEIEDIVTADKDLAHKMMKPFNLGKGTTSYPATEDNPEMVKFYAKALKAIKKKLAGKESPYEVVPRVKFWRDDL